MISDRRKQLAPSLEDFDAIAREAFAALSVPFRARCGNLVIHVAEFADDETLAAMGIEDPFELTGLYEGIDVTADSATDPAPLTSHVHLYRRPILDEWAERGDVELGALVVHVLIHEIGHHFGLSDEQIHALEAAAG